jgi:hypothetical protein
VRQFVSLLIFAGLCAAQVQQEAQPDFIWKGTVDGIAYLRLHANKLEVQIKDGAPVTGQQFRFAHPLPDSSHKARLRVLEGRGYVRIVEQPRIENQFTLVVSIEDRQDGSSPYSIALYWDSSDRLFERPRAGERMESIAWRGRVDEEAVVICQARSCSSSAAHGAPVASEHFKLSQPLPDQPVELTLIDKQGRGEIRLVEQPSEKNRYTARVSIRDLEKGSSEYSFKLEWSRSNSKEAPLTAVGRGLLWSGSVTGRVRITVRGGATISSAPEGGRVENSRAEMLTPMPARSNIQPVVKILNGRGSAQIIERPTEQNNFQLVFEITDPGPGSDRYELELDW